MRRIKISKEDLPKLVALHPILRDMLTPQEVDPKSDLYLEWSELVDKQDNVLRGHAHALFLTMKKMGADMNKPHVIEKEDVEELLRFWWRETVLGFCVELDRIGIHVKE